LEDDVDIASAFASPWAFGSVALLCSTLVVLVLFGKRNIHVGPKGLSATTEITKMEPLMPEKYARYALQLVERALTHRDKMRDMWPHCLQRQMKCYEEQEKVIISRLVQAMTTWIKDTKISGDMAAAEVAHWRAELRNAFSEVKDRFRESCTNNHFYAMTEAEWSKYVKDKVALLHFVITDHLDNMWISAHIPRDTLFTVTDDTVTGLEDIAYDVYEKARRHSINTHQAEVEERASYNSFVAYVTGMDLEQECV
jgi:hypothetical protein